MSYRVIPLLLAVLLVSACGTVEKQPTPQPRPLAAQPAERMLQQGDYLNAAAAFGRLADQSPAPLRQEYQLRALQALVLAERVPAARQLLADIDLGPLDEAQLLHRRLLAARLALLERAPQLALDHLAEPPRPGTAAERRAEYHLLRAQAFAAWGNWLEAARARVEREPLLADLAEIRRNQEAIWAALGNLSERALLELRGTPPDVLSGWLELTYLAKTHAWAPQDIPTQLDNWRRRYYGHPALSDFTDALLSRHTPESRYPQHIALILPFSGQFAPAAVAIRDGFLAAYYSLPAQDRPTVRFYDMGTHPTGVIQSYEQAVRDGAEFVVGPLQREAVHVLAGRSTLPVPTLALNYADATAAATGNLFQFGLSPEDEARQVAERAWLDGHATALMLFPRGDWGRRVATAFAQRWGELGGELLHRQEYNPDQNDFSGPIRAMLHIDASRARHREVTALLGGDVKFQPRRRQDADFIFLGGFSRQARQIRPQLRFHFAGTIPVYATSHVYTGHHNPDLDRDMDGIRFGDMPFLLGLGRHDAALGAEMAGELKRLFAFGADAFQVIPALPTLASYPFERYGGETGSLRLDEQGRLQRQVSWAQFRRGVPRLDVDAESLSEADEEADPS